MTLNRLHKLLGQLINKGYGRREICVDKTSFQHALESDGVTYQDVCGVRIEAYEMCDGDGFLDTRKDGSVRVRTGVLLYGAAAGKEATPK